MRIELDGGKYVYIFDAKSGQNEALRYGEKWRDFTGDGFILALAHRIEELEVQQHDPCVAAIQFALDSGLEGLDFLRCWFEGDFDAIRNEWPEAPEAVFIGADPLHKTTSQVQVPDSVIDQHLDAVLRASGSALKHYSMQKTKDDMRAAMRSAMSIPAPLTEGFREIRDEFAAVLIMTGPARDVLLRSALDKLDAILASEVRTNGK